MSEQCRRPRGPMRTRSFEIAGHHLFDHLHRFLDGLPRILPLDPVEFLQGEPSARGSPSMPSAQTAFNRTRASSSHRVSINGSTARGSPSRPSASAAFHRVPSLSSESLSTRASRVFDVTCHLHPGVGCSYVVHGVRRRFCRGIGPVR